MAKYIAKKDIDTEGWEVEPNEVKQGDILEVRYWHGSDTLMLGDKAVCDTDSEMFYECFQLVEL